MTIYKDVNGREFTYNEYWNKVYLDEKRPHVDTLIRHKWPEEKPKAEKEGETTPYLLRFDDGNGAWCQVYHQFGDGFGYIEKYITHWWELPEVTE